MQTLLRLRFLKALSLLTILTVTLLGVYPPQAAQADAKSLVAGAAVGAGVVLAWPMITAGVGAICGGIGAAGVAVAGAVTTGVAAASGAVAVGGAMAGGAVAGAGAAVGAGVTSAFGAVGGAIAAITASPLFIPALLIAGAAVATYFIYKHFKKKKETGPVRISDNTIATKSTSSKTTTAVSTKTSTKNTGSTSTGVTQTLDKNRAYENYQAAYKRYIECLQNDSTGRDQKTLEALEELRTHEAVYRKAMK
jgi:hypothetical protein